jgi:FMN phosphatase YigB (HAD superfamily)
MRAKEFNQAKQSLVIFDIDDTLLHTTAKIKVVSQGRVVRTLTNQEFNNYELQPGEEFDFGEFRNAEKFNQESKPIGPMVNKLKTILDHSPNSKVIMLTARADFDNRDLFLKTFTDLGIDMSRVHVHRAGNLPGDEIPAEKKAVWVRRYADTGLYDHIRLYDDSRSNLAVFADLKKEYPNIDFRAYYVGPEGSTTALKESKIKDHKNNFVEMFGKFLPLAMHYLELDHLPKIHFETKIADVDQPTFGKYVNDEKTLYVALMNRHPNDILRTVAHELCHYKQDTEHELNADSGTTGSPEENQANQMAGIIMRHFNKHYPEYLSSKPITESQRHGFYTVHPTDENGRFKIIGSPTKFPNSAMKMTFDYLRTTNQPVRVEIKDHKGTFDSVTINPGDRVKDAIMRLGFEDDSADFELGVDENFADGRNPQDKGDSARHGIPKHASISTLRKIAKQGGRKGQLAHWQANMRSGRAKHK